MPPSNPSSNPEVAALEKRIKALEVSKITVKQLPMNELRKALAREPQNPTDILLPHSIGADLIKEGTNVFAGVNVSGFNVTWPGVATPVAALTLAVPSSGVYLAGYNMDVESVEGGYFVGTLAVPGGSPQGVLNDGIGSRNTISESWPFRATAVGQKAEMIVYMATAGRYLIQSGTLWYMRLGG